MAKDLLAKIILSSSDDVINTEEKSIRVYDPNYTTLATQNIHSKMSCHNCVIRTKKNNEKFSY